jgi:hypothetical protein
MYSWRRMEKISWTAGVKNLEVLHTDKEDMNIPHKIKEGRLTRLVTSCAETAF